MYKSVDFGVTMQPAATGANYMDVASDQTGLVLNAVAYLDYIRVSRDGGSTWSTRVNVEGTLRWLAAVASDDGSTIFALPVEYGCVLFYGGPFLAGRRGFFEAKQKCELTFVTLYFSLPRASGSCTYPGTTAPTTPAQAWQRRPGGPWPAAPTAATPWPSTTLEQCSDPRTRALHGLWPRTPELGLRWP